MNFHDNQTQPGCEELEFPGSSCKETLGAESHSDVSCFQFRIFQNNWLDHTYTMTSVYWKS